MRTAFLVLFTICGILGAAAQEYTVEGYFTGVDNGTVIHLAPKDDPGHPVDTGKVKNGRITLRGTVGEGTHVMVLHNILGKDFPTAYNSLPLYVEAGKTITVRGDDYFLGTWRVESDIPEQIEDNEFREIIRPEMRYEQQISVEISDNMDKVRAVRRSLTKLSGKREEKAMAELRTYARRNDSLLKEMKVAEELTETARFEALRRLDVTEMWLDKYEDRLLDIVKEIDEVTDERLAEAKELYAKIPAEMLETEQGEKVTSAYNILFGEQKLDDSSVAKVDSLPMVEEGGPMLDIDFLDLEGNVRHLAEFRGRYILLDFWAYWCGPCIASMPHLARLAKEYEGRLTVVSISRDSEQQWRGASAQHNIEWHNFNASVNGDALWDAYGIKSIPYYVVIAPDGTVVGMRTGFKESWIREKLD